MFLNKLTLTPYHLRWSSFLLLSTGQCLVWLYHCNTSLQGAGGRTGWPKLHSRAFKNGWMDGWTGRWMKDGRYFSKLQECWGSLIDVQYWLSEQRGRLVSYRFKLVSTFILLDQVLHRHLREGCVLGGCGPNMASSPKYKTESIPLGLPITWTQGYFKRAGFTLSHARGGGISSSLLRQCTVLPRSPLISQGT